MITKVSAEQINGDSFEVFHVTFDTVRASKGFQRATSVRRPQYRYNGMVVARDVFLGLQKAARRDAAKVA